MNPQYVTIVIDKPDQKQEAQWNSWLKFLAFTQEKKELARNDESLSDNIWLLPLSNGLSPTVSLLTKPAKTI